MIMGQLFPQAKRPRCVHLHVACLQKVLCIPRLYTVVHAFVLVGAWVMVMTESTPVHVC